MTAPTSPDERKEKPDLARFLQDWTALWREELQAQAKDPDRMSPRDHMAMLAGLLPGMSSNDPNRMAPAMLAGLLPGMSANDPNRMAQAMLAGLLPGISKAPMSGAAPAADLPASHMPASHMPVSHLTVALETWRAAMVAWAEMTGVPPSSLAAARDPTATPRSPAAAAASDPRDAEIERLARRVDELEARLAKLESPRRRRG